MECQLSNIIKNDLYKCKYSEEICKINDELKVIYHSSDSICICLNLEVTEINSWMRLLECLKKTEKIITYQISNSIK